MSWSSPRSTRARSSPGTIVYAKAGNLWLQCGAEARQLTDTGRDSMPSWSPDGKWIYFVETTPDRGFFPASGAARHYTINIPTVIRVRPDGSDREAVIDGTLPLGPQQLLEVVHLAPPAGGLARRQDGRGVQRLAAAQPPGRGAPVLSISQAGSSPGSTSRRTRPLGHQDAAWRPDGKLLAFVMNSRDGARGTPRIFLYNPASVARSP